MKNVTKTINKKMHEVQDQLRTFGLIDSWERVWEEVSLPLEIQTEGLRNISYIRQFYRESPPTTEIY